MTRTHIITGFDIGSQNIKILIASKNPKKEKLEVIFQKGNTFGRSKKRGGG